MRGRREGKSQRWRWKTEAKQGLPAVSRLLHRYPQSSCTAWTSLAQIKADKSSACGRGGVGSGSPTLAEDCLASDGCWAWHRGGCWEASGALGGQPTAMCMRTVLNDLCVFLKEHMRLGGWRAVCAGKERELFKSMTCTHEILEQVERWFKPVYFKSDSHFGARSLPAGQNSTTDGCRPHRHTLLQGAHQYMRARKGSPMATARTTRNFTAMVCCRKPERFSYQMDRSCCWQFGWATN